MGLKADLDLDIAEALLLAPYLVKTKGYRQVRVERA